MSASEPFISFCIPTYNQPDRVAALLHSLEKEITADAEIVIRDDSPGEETAAVVAASALAPRIRYFHGKKEGFDAAILFLVQEARGTYVWWFGDDVLRAGGFARVEETLRAHPQIGFLFVNSANTNTPDQPSFRFPKSFFFRDRDQVIETLSDLLAFASATVFLRAKALPSLAAARAHIGKSFMSLYVIMQVLATDGGAYYFLNDPIILTDPKDPTQKLWYDTFEVFGINFYTIVREFQGKFGRGALRTMLAKTFESVWRTILVHRARGYGTGMDTPSPKFLPLLRRYWTFPEFWLAAPFLLMPRWLLRGCYRAYKYFFPKTHTRLSEKGVVIE